MLRALVLTLVAAIAAAAQSPAEAAIRRRIGSFPGTVSLYAKNLRTGKTVALHETDPVRTASTIKLPVMLTVFDAVAQGKARWTDTLTVTGRDKVSGSGVIGTELSDGVQLPLRDVLNLMMVLSDNSATNMLIERLTADAVNRCLDRLNLPGTRLMRKVRGDGNDLKAPGGWSAAGRLPENQKYGLGKSTPKDMVSILERLERGEIVSPEASREMLAIMRRCQDDTGVRRRLNGYEIANKTGALDALRSDVALVTTGSGEKIAMAITVEGIPEVNYTPENQGSILIADLAEILVRALAIK
jgi:beta-lactamase class A